jgi:20S proteasome alpha/beta subunit
VRGVTVLNQTDDKSRALNQHNLLIFAGESGDTIQFAEYIQANVQLYGMKNDTELNSDAVAAFTRREMADNLRTRVITLLDHFDMAARFCLPVALCLCSVSLLAPLAGANCSKRTRC